VSGRHEATDSDTQGLHETVLEELRSTPIVHGARLNPASQ
jgi:hypothetical protein